MLKFFFREAIYVLRFLLLWDTTEEVFFRCGIQRKSFFSDVGYNKEGIPPLWDATEEDFFRCEIQRRTFFSIVSHNAGNFSSIVSYTTAESYAVYHVPEKSLALYPA